MTYPSFGYLGNKYNFSELILDSVKNIKFKTFCDATAGSCSIPYIVQLNKKCNIITNDIGYYSYLISNSLFPYNISHSLKFESTEGFLSEKIISNPKIYGNWRKDTANMMDSLITSYTDYPQVKLSVARFLNNGKFRFRGKGYFLKYVNTITPDQLKLEVLTNMKKINSWNLCIDISNGNNVLNFFIDTDTDIVSYKSYNLDWIDFAKEHDNFKDVLVSIDPAWPENPESGFGKAILNGNPYSFYDIIDSILMQKEKVPVNYDYDLNEYMSRMKNFFDIIHSKGGNDFMVWYQDRKNNSIDTISKLFESFLPEFEVVKTSEQNRKGGSNCKEVCFIIRTNP